MDRRIETRVVPGIADELETIIQKDACEVWWITVNVTKLQSGVLKIYDGFDTNSKLQWQFEGDYEPHHCNFIPPIPCDYGLTIYIDANVASYTVAYRGKGWPREPK